MRKFRPGQTVIFRDSSGVEFQRQRVVAILRHPIVPDGFSVTFDNSATIIMHGDHKYEVE